MSNLKREIAQQRPFSSLAEEALLNLLRTADSLNRAMQQTTRPHGITATQYNVLRILRGAQPGGLSCSAIGDRMIAADPDITRLLARLKTLKLVRQQRDKKDARVLMTHITAAGLALLADLDDVVRAFPQRMLGHIEDSQLERLIGLLELARMHCSDRRPPVSCTGTQQPCDRKPAEPAHR